MSIKLNCQGITVRLGTPFRANFLIYLLRHINFFKGCLGLMMDWELLNFALLHPEFLINVLPDSKDALHSDKLRELELYIQLIREES